jgi:hypothetical protein
MFFDFAVSKSIFWRNAVPSQALLRLSLTTKRIDPTAVLGLTPNNNRHLSKPKIINAC